MTRYHMQSSGNVARCNAIKRECPLGADTLHADSPQALYEVFEQRMRASTVPAPTTKTERPSFTYGQDPYGNNKVGYYEPYWYSNYSESDGKIKPESITIGETAETLRTRLEEQLGTPLPEEVNHDVDWRNPELNFVAEVSQGYYGEECTVRLKRSLQETIEQAHHARPNAQSQSGMLEWARSIGENTAGFNETAMAKTLTHPQLPADVRRKINEANTVSSQNIPLAKVKVSSDNLRGDSAPMTLNNSLKYNEAGIVVSNDDGTYTFVGNDYSRLRAVTGRKNWKFFVLSKHEERTSYFGPTKHAVNPAPIDVSDW